MSGLKSQYLKVEVCLFQEDIAECLRDILACHQYHTATKVQWTLFLNYLYSYVLK